MPPQTSVSSPELVDSPAKRTSNGPNRAVIAAHTGMLAAERRINGGGWAALNRPSQAEEDCFHRLIARVRSGEIDPRESFEDSLASREIRLIVLPD
jgi:hypothetical protein